MSAISFHPDANKPATNVIWSRGGGSFRRLVWKELSEAIGVWGVIAVVTVCSVGLIDRQAIRSVPALWLHAAPALFALIFGARAFAREVSGGTWELLRSVGAPAIEVVGSKWLVGGISSVLLTGLSIMLAAALRLPLRIAEPGEPTVWYLLVVLLSLAVSLVVSQWSRTSWQALALAGMLCLSLWTLWAIWFNDFSWLTQQSRWQCNAMLSLTLVALPALFAMQVWNARWTLFDQSGISGSRRWRQVFWRMVWKELLAARDFWLAVLGIVVLLDGLAWWSFRDVGTRHSVISAMSILLPLLHSLGCGAIAFALEREDGTQDWLRRISAPAGAVFAAKLLVSQASILTLSSLVLLTTQRLLLAEPRLSDDAVIYTLLAVTLNGVIALGASMLTRRVLPAMFFAFLGVAAIDLPLLVIAFRAIDKANPILGSSLMILPGWLLLGTTLMAMEFWLADRWLNERRWWKPVWRGDAAKVVKPQRSVAWFEQSSSPEWKEFGRLLWREWMEARHWLWALPVAFAPWLMNEAAESNRGQSSGTAWQIVVTLEMSLLAILSISLTILPTLWGVWAFHHDHRHGLFRFLSNRGGSPTRIWLSKHAIWLPQVLVLALIAGGTFGFHLNESHRPTLGIFMGFALIGALQGYAAGQWLAQLIRSPLTSLFLAGVLSLLLAGWAQLLWVIHVPWPYHLVPAATLLFASWLHSRDWLEERWTCRAWLKIAAAVLLPAAELVLALEVQGYPLLKTLRDWKVLP